MILSMALQAVYNIVDSAFVGNMKVGSEAALNALTRACSLHSGICVVKENPEETLIKNNTETQVHGILSNDMFDIIKYD